MADGTHQAGSGNTRFKKLSVATATEAIMVLLELRKMGFFSFRGQRDTRWPLGPKHKIDLESWAGLKKSETEEPNPGGNDPEIQDMFDRERAALIDLTDAPREQYWQSKSVRKYITTNLRQFLNHSQLLRGNYVTRGQNAVGNAAKSREWWSDLIFAHHYGLNTLLLDWTTNPLVALYFAVEDSVLKSKADKDMRGAVFAIRVRGTPAEKNVKDKRWHNFDEVTQKFLFGEFCPYWIMINPPLNSDRIMRQSGKFSYHPSINDLVLLDKNDNMPGEQGLHDDEALIKIEIGQEGKDDPSKDIRKLLGIVNIHRSSLFPDYDGVARYINDEWYDIARDNEKVLPGLTDNTQSKAITELMQKLKELGIVRPKMPSSVLIGG